MFTGFMKLGEYFPTKRRSMTPEKGQVRFVQRPPENNLIARKYYDYLAEEFKGLGFIEKQKLLNVLTRYTKCPMGARLNLRLLCRDGFMQEVPVEALAAA